jgi:hypothetical protein
METVYIIEYRTTTENSWEPDSVFKSLDYAKDLMNDLYEFDTSETEYRISEYVRRES